MGFSYDSWKLKQSFLTCKPPNPICFNLFLLQHWTSFVLFKCRICKYLVMALFFPLEALTFGTSENSPFSTTRPFRGSSGLGLKTVGCCWQALLDHFTSCSRNCNPMSQRATLGKYFSLVTVTSASLAASAGRCVGSCGFAPGPAMYLHCWEAILSSAGSCYLILFCSVIFLLLKLWLLNSSWVTCKAKIKCAVWDKRH